jgi:hypothetical protein
MMSFIQRGRTSVARKVNTEVVLVWSIISLD